MKATLLLLAILLTLSAASKIDLRPTKNTRIDPLPIHEGLKDHSHDYSFTYSGGAPFCAQCGAQGAFACSNQPSWKPVQSFVDAEHSDQSVLKVEVILTGSFACTSKTPTTVVGIMLNGVDVDVLNVNGKKLCKCNTCDGSVSFVKTSPLGWPIYSVDGKTANNVTVRVYTGSICLSSLTVRVTYGTPAYPLKTFYFGRYPSNMVSVPNGLCTLTSGFSLPGDGIRSFLTFVNPLPKNSVLYSMDLVLYGTYFATPQGGCSNITGSLSMNNFPVGDPQTLSYPRSYNSSDIVTTPCRNYGCDGQWLFSMSQLYQNGVPNYVYDTSSYNFITWNGGSTILLESVDFWLYYYVPQ